MGTKSAKKASKERKLSADAEARDAGGTSQTRQISDNPLPEVHRPDNSDATIQSNTEQPNTDTTGPEQEHKRSYGPLVGFCDHFDALVNKTRDEFGENQVVYRVITNLMQLEERSEFPQPSRVPKDYSLTLSEIE